MGKIVAILSAHQMDMDAKRLFLRPHPSPSRSNASLGANALSR